MKRYFVAYLIFSFAFLAHATENLVTLSASYLPKKRLLALNFENNSGWHTYWKNPGDAGLPISARFSIDGKNLVLTPLEWPIPQKFREQGDIITFGYTDAYSLFFRTPENFFTLYKGKNLDISSELLLCKEVCIPQKKNLSIPVDIEYGKELSAQKKAKLENRLTSLPEAISVPVYLDITLGVNKSQKGFVFLYSLSKNVTLRKKNLDILTPFPHNLFDFKHESLKKDKNGHIYGYMPADWHGEYAEPKIPLPQNGVLNPPQKVAFLFNDPITNRVSVIEKEFRFFSPKSSVQMEKFFFDLDNLDSRTNKGTSVFPGLLVYLLFAFLGGLILNIMPCVLPVISLKLFSLIKHSRNSHLNILKHNLSYTLGVLATFIGLGLTVSALKWIGVSIGWGFQLQSPHFISIVILVLFVLALNLFGLFEFITPGGQTLGQTKGLRGFGGDFANGVFSTILATPCSAPFLGTALTFAFQSSAPVILLIFTFIGLGLSSPFIVIGLFPSLISFLPRPGRWMEYFKMFLGLSLLLAVIWALDIFNTQVGGRWPFMLLNIVMALTFFAFYFRAKISKNVYFSVLVFSLPILLFVNLLLSNLENQQKLESILSGPWKTWSVAKTETYRKENKKAFIDFTAKWCLTCKINEKLVLETEEFQTYAKKNDIKLLLADWTTRDPVIGNWLNSQGVVGVPAYFAVKGGKLIKLGETITLAEIKRVFD